MIISPVPVKGYTACATYYVNGKAIDSKDIQVGVWYTIIVDYRKIVKTFKTKRKHQKHNR